MAMISAFSKFVVLFVTAHVKSALNSPVSFVHTVSNVTLESGKEATLTCNYKNPVFAVYWRYESTTSPRELLVALDKYYEEGKRSGPGYDEARFNITDDYSLIIHEVHATDEGKYICEVSDFETGSVFRNHTDVTTVVVAEIPFVRIEQCEDEDSADEINDHCILHTASDDLFTQLNCTVVGVKPLVDLTWEASMPPKHWKQVMNESTLTTRERGYGIFDQTLTLIVDTSYIKSNKEYFTCVAKGLAVDGMANYTIVVYPHQGINVAVTIVLSVVFTLLFTFVIVVLWRLRSKWWCRNGEDLRKHEDATTPVDEDHRKHEDASTPSNPVKRDAFESKGESNAPPGEDPEKHEDARTPLMTGQLNTDTTKPSGPVTPSPQSDEELAGFEILDSSELDNVSNPTTEEEKSPSTEGYFGAISAGITYFLPSLITGEKED